MRELTIRQKKLLDKWYEENKNETGVTCFFDLQQCEAFPLELMEKLEKINDTEILYQEINRYIGDKVVDICARIKKCKIEGG